MSLIETAEAKAIEVLERCVHDRGLKAAAKYYPQIWARDSIISALGALTVDDERFVTATQRTLESLAAFQCPETGRIPNYIPIDQPKPRLPVNEAMDSNLWYVIGHGVLFARTEDAAFLQRYYPSIEAAIRWARFMDYNNDGLMECFECADWKDTWDNRYHNLNVNVLYAAALAHMAVLTDAAGRDRSIYDVRRAKLINLINANFWIHPDGSAEREQYAPFRPGPMANNYAANAAVNWISDFYFPHLPMKEPAPRRLDTLGNLGAILYDVADAYQTNRILNYIDEHAVNEPYPVRVTYPTVRPGEPDCHAYYNNRGYCIEHSGHNGGIWPFVGGFYVAALVKAGRLDAARTQLDKLAALNRLPAGRNENADDWVCEWGFCEHCHGQTGRGLGAQWQAWSAGMFLYALDAVRDAQCRFLY
jgi:glycogen debranching enzyme